MIKRMCQNIGHSHDLNHFKYKKGISFYCNHDYHLDSNDVFDDQTFLQFCYYLNMHQNEEDIYKVLRKNNTYNRHFINDQYSAISAVLLAKFTSLKKKRRYIKILLSNGFQVSKGDRQMANYELYKQIFPIKKKIMLFLSSNIFEDIKKYILRCLINQYDPLLC